ncbi:hypothetical protein [Microbacterium testaceum]|uniref:hypothetical protein n=1 Tax=Microbacterium testaceum TaxID=2033 RepID=UPI0022E412B6|nr:hypothetical protein [Microbacterium testaceum]
MEEAAGTHLRSADVPRVFRPRVRVGILIGCAALFLMCVAIYGGIASITSGSTDVLIGNTFGWQIRFYALLVGWAAATVAVFTVRCRAWWLLLAIPARVIAIGVLFVGFLLLPLTSSQVTPVMIDGCLSGYLAAEPNGLSPEGSIGVRDGLFFQTVQTFTGDDFARPFVSGAYSAEQRGEVIDIAYAGGSADPAFTLPAISSDCSGR